MLPKAAASGWNDGGAWETNEWDFDDFDKQQPAEWKQNKQGKASDVQTDYSTLDLNKLNDDELRRHKHKMDKQYDKNQIKPNHPNFVYDKRIDFKTPDDVRLEDSWE